MAMVLKMLVRDFGDHFQLVLQPDHAEVSGQIAAAWTRDLPLSPDIRAALDCAATRHDEGWAVWERHPRLDEHGRPQIFYAVPLDSLLSSYRACVDVLAAENPAAGLLVSMHVSGLQRNRYGVMDASDTSPLSELRPAVREFVRAEEDRQTALVDELGFDEQERWRAYRQLQVYDVVSLYLGLSDLAAGERTAIPPPPEHLRSGEPQDPEESSLEIEPLPDPWTVQCEPFPFGAEPTRLTMRRRVLTKRDWPTEESFRADFRATPVDEVTICVRSSSAR
jgi:Protein of unknown function (DUF3891)